MQLVARKTIMQQIKMLNRQASTYRHTISRLVSNIAWNAGDFSE